MYQRDTLEQRLDAVDYVAVVTVSAFGSGRYNTATGFSPEGQPTVNDAGWIRYRPITVRVTDLYKAR